MFIKIIIDLCRKMRHNTHRRNGNGLFHIFKRRMDMRLFRAVDYFFANRYNEKAFDGINSLLESIGLTKNQIASVDALIKDVADNATQKGFWTGYKANRDNQ